MAYGAAIVPNEKLVDKEITEVYRIFRHNKNSVLEFDFINRRVNIKRHTLQAILDHLKNENLIECLKFGKYKYIYPKDTEHSSAHQETVKALAESVGQVIPLSLNLNIEETQNIVAIANKKAKLNPKDFQHMIVEFITEKPGSDVKQMAEFFEMDQKEIGLKLYYMFRRKLLNRVANTNEYGNLKFNYYPLSYVLPKDNNTPINNVTNNDNVTVVSNSPKYSELSGLISEWLPNHPGALTADIAEALNANMSQVSAILGIMHKRNEVSRAIAKPPIGKSGRRYAYTYNEYYNPGKKVKAKRKNINTTVEILEPETNNTATLTSESDSLISEADKLYFYSIMERVKPHLNEYDIKWLKMKELIP